MGAKQRFMGANAKNMGANAKNVGANVAIVTFAPTIPLFRSEKSPVLNFSH